MENAEVEVALEELENRLERLRALYEQYFMGIERIEPAIPRKDVDRRIYVLRHEKIRNTAKRFKLQTIISRYNTFQQYWQRICREIENGTYKRHLIRAERIAPGQMLTIAARKRLGRAALEAATPDSAPPPARESAPPSVQPEAAAAPAPPPVRSLVPRPGAGAGPPKAVPPPKPSARPAKPAPNAQAAPTAPSAAAASPKFESLDLDFDFLGDWDPSVAATKAKRAPDAPARPFGRALNQPLGAAPPAPLNTTARVAPAPSAAKSVVAPMPPAAPPRVVAERPMIAPRPPAAPATPVAAASSPAVSAAPGLAPATAVAGISIAAKPAATTAGLAAQRPPAKPATPPAPVAPAPPSQPTPLAKPPAAAPVVAKPAAAAAPLAKPPVPAAAKPAPPLAAKPAPAPSPAVSDARVRELHARLVEAKRQTRDPAAVSIEGLAKSMKATEAKLREQHKNRKIDFDVVIKDGKAVLKPIVR